MEIVSLSAAHLPDAARLFSTGVAEQKKAVPALATGFLDPAQVMPRLEYLTRAYEGLAAVDNGRLVGYLAWFLIDDFRNSGRKAAYCPEWSHAAGSENPSDVYRDLYRAASHIWFQKSCNMFAVTFLPHNPELQNFWFWNGFGLTVVDAVRPVQPLPEKPTSTLTIRKADLPDLPSLYQLELEHCMHYSEPPVLMFPQDARTREDWSALLTSDAASVWIAYHGDVPDSKNAASYIVFQRNHDGASALVRSPEAVAVTAAYTRPAFRGQHTAVSLLDLGLRHYASLGYTCCSVDFESINPEASGYWMRYFQPVCYSTFRVPERQPSGPNS